MLDLDGGGGAAGISGSITVVSWRWVEEFPSFWYLL